MAIVAPVDGDDLDPAWAQEVSAAINQAVADLAVTIPASETSNETTTGTTNSTSFTSTLTGGTACLVTFTAPPSGTVQIINTSSIDNDSTGTGSVGYQVAAGTSAGSDIRAAATNRSLRHQGTDLFQGSYVDHLDGLTPGAEYTVQQMFIVTAGTMTTTNKRLTVVPIT